MTKLFVNTDLYLAKLDELVAAIKNEYSVTEPDLIIEVAAKDLPNMGVNILDSKEIVNLFIQFLMEFSK